MSSANDMNTPLPPPPLLHRHHHSQPQVHPPPQPAHAPPPPPPAAHNVVAKLRSKSQGLSRHRALTTNSATTSTTPSSTSTTHTTAGASVGSANDEPTSNHDHTTSSLRHSGDSGSSGSRPSHSRSKSSGSPGFNQTLGSGSIGRDDGSNTTGATGATTTTTGGDAVSCRPRSPSASSIPATCYAVAKYGFRAVRIDELSLQAGEAVLIVAQSTPEWFVAKPIGKLGQPGLVPVSFVEIRDMVTNQPVSNPRAAVLAARIPSVHEWQKNRREYTNNAVSLENNNHHHGYGAHVNGRSHRSAPPTVPNRAAASAHAQHRDLIRAIDSASNGSSAYEQGVKDAVKKLSQQSLRSQESRNSENSLRGDGAKSNPAVTPVTGHVKRYVYDKHNRCYRYHLLCKMRDGRCWLLSRTYEDFYDLHTRLLIVEAELESDLVLEMNQSLIPPLFAPVRISDDDTARSRGQVLNTFAKRLFALPGAMLKHGITQEFFVPQKGDQFLNEPLSSVRSQQAQKATSAAGSDHHHHQQQLRPRGSSDLYPSPCPPPNAPLPPIPNNALPSSLAAGQRPPASSSSSLRHARSRGGSNNSNSNKDPGAGETLTRRPTINTGITTATTTTTTTPTNTNTTNTTIPLTPPRASFQTHERQESGDTVFSTDSAATQLTAPSALSSSPSASLLCSPPESSTSASVSVSSARESPAASPVSPHNSNSSPLRQQQQQHKLQQKQSRQMSRLKSLPPITTTTTTSTTETEAAATTVTTGMKADLPSVLRIKIHYRDECFALRLPGDVSVPSFLARVRERVGLPVVASRGDNESGGEGEGEGETSDVSIEILSPEPRLRAQPPGGADSGESDESGQKDAAAAVIPVHRQSQEEFDEAKGRSSGKITVFVKRGWREKKKKDIKSRGKGDEMK